MKSLTLGNLTLDNKDCTYIHEGNLTITEYLYISNCELTVLGQLTLEKTAKVEIVNGSIRAETLELNGSFLDSLCTIFVKNLYAFLVK